MGPDTVAFLSEAFLHLLALAVSGLALYRTRRETVRRAASTELHEIEARSTTWKSAALELREQVESAIDRLESKRRAVAAVEARLRARENGETEIELAEQQRQEEELSGPDVRAALREQRRQMRAG